jgi:hypothetical protein
VQQAIEKQQRKVDKAQAELAAADARVKEDFENELKNEELKLGQAQQALQGLQQQGLAKEQLLAVAGDYIAQQLDEQKGHEVTEHSIFQAHASKYEVRGCGCGCALAASAAVYDNGTSGPIVWPLPGGATRGLWRLEQRRGRRWACRAAARPAARPAASVRRAAPPVARWRPWRKQQPA